MPRTLFDKIWEAHEVAGPLTDRSAAASNSRIDWLIDCLIDPIAFITPIATYLTNVNMTHAEMATPTNTLRNNGTHESSLHAKHVITQSAYRTRRNICTQRSRCCALDEYPRQRAAQEEVQLVSTEEHRRQQAFVAILRYRFYIGSAHSANTRILLLTYRRCASVARNA